MINISEKLDEYKASKIRLSPVVSNRASEVGHPCERYLVYLRTRWQDKKLYNVGLQYIFDEGNFQEASLIDDLKKSGLKIIKEQIDFQDKKLQLTGHLDFFISDNGYEIPVEAKSMNPFDWEKINTFNDLVESKKLWLRKIPIQVNLYLFLSNHESGILALKNKSTGRCKFIEVTLDYDLAQSIIEKIERVNSHVSKDTLPDKINDESVCESCGFNEICLPDVYHEGKVLFDEELESQIDMAMELKTKIKPLQDEYDELNEQLKKKLYGVEEAIVGQWVIKGKMITKKPFTYNGGEYWDMRIKKVK